MQLSTNFSSLQAFQFSQTSYTTTKLSGNALQEETKDSKANVVPQLAVNEEGRQTSTILTQKSSANNSLNLNDFQKSILDKALSKIAEIKSEMLSLYEELFGTSKTSSKNQSISLESILNSSLSTSLAQKNLQNGISITQGFQQSLEISMEGTIISSDGSKKQISLSIGISQSFMQNLQLNTQNTVQNNTTQSSTNKNLVDPLVIDYAGNGVELSDTKMRFDLDSDGTSEQISTLKQGSGFLALDKNNDGKINNGSELFGTKSGDGFKDLSIYDSNNDGKIDKEDPIYDKLRIWMPDENGEGQLVGLGEKGIGTIYLDAKDSKEMLYGQNGDLLGVKQKSADFLYNNGANGKIHHIDLVSEKIKDEALNNQAQNDAILSNNLVQTLANRAYTSLEGGFNFSSLFSGISSVNKQDSSLTSTFSFSFSLNTQTSIAALQSGKGVEAEVSKIWLKLESSFNSIVYNNQQDSTKEQDYNKDVKQLMESFNNLNRLIFDPLNLQESTSIFKESFLNLKSLNKLLSA
ncbi:MAG: hypothetical protein PUB96_02405 [Helicobacteraceae bacterium]|nr:hypothetical protein [Helicobacteraceae bacterium]